jgi:hypothetical protein
MWRWNTKGDIEIKPTKVIHDANFETPHLVKLECEQWGVKVYVNQQKFEFLKRITGATSFRTNSEKVAPVIFIKGDEPVAVLLSMRYSE